MSEGLGVFIGHDRVGSLSRGQNSTIIFERDANAPDDLVVSLAWEQGRWEESPSLHPVFEQCLPEGGLRRHLQEAFFGTLKSRDDLTTLRIVGSSLIGRMRFAESLESLLPVPPINIRDEIIAARSGSEILIGLLDRFARFSGVAGVQPKFLVRDEDVSGNLTLSGSTHLVKTFDESDYPGLAINEFACLQAAAKSGLTIPHVEVSEDGKWLSVERFDLVHDEEGNARYLAFEDMCSLSGRTSPAKYHGSYEEIAKTIRAFSSESLEDMQQFFTMVALSCALRNGDAHRKNFGILYEGRHDARLAPAFDIICTEVYPGLESRMALTLDGMDSWPDAKQLESFGIRQCLLDRNSVRDIIAKVSEAVTESLSLLNDERMPASTARMMKLTVEEGVASIRGTAKRRGI